MLPASVFDPATNKLTPNSTEPDIRCQVINSVSQVTLLPILSNIQDPGTGWKLVFDSSVDAVHDKTLTEASPTSLIRPVTGTESYALTATAPSGSVLLGVERLKLIPSCDYYAANNPSSAPSTCWEALSSAQLAALNIAPSTHEVFRVTAQLIPGVPLLPLTGGIGAWVFTLAGGIGIAAGAVILLARRQANGRLNRRP